MSEQQYNEEQRRENEDKDTRFAYTVVGLEQGDAGYREGGRFMIEDQTGGHLVLRHKQGMFNFCHQHGIYLVTKAEMKRIKAEGETP
jgi:hypothetical protein